MNIPINQRVELIHTNYAYTDLKPGDRGTACQLKPDGSVDVRWDNGSRLSLNRKLGDEWKSIAE